MQLVRMCQRNTIAAMPSPSAQPARASSTLLVATLLYTAMVSVGTGVILHGVFFITAEVFGFGNLANLLLGVAVQLPYIPAALLSGRICRRMGARRVTFFMIAGMTITAGCLATMPAAPWWWILAPAYNFFAGMQWPIVESYVASGRHGRDMRRAIGLFNIVWAATIAPGLWLVSLMHDRPGMTFALLAGIHALSAIVVFNWPKRPPPHDSQTGRGHTTEAYPFLLRSSRILLPMAYILVYLLTPLLPGIWDRLEVSARLAPALSSAWMIVRVGVFTAMFLRPGWHGRWFVLLTGGLALAGGMLMVLAQASVSLAIAGLIIIGIGQGMVYYAALYYGMAVEHAAVESGGRHEAIIGIGYLAGPLLGSAAIAISPVAGAIVVTGLIALGGAVLGTRPYLARRRKTAQECPNE